MVIQLNESALGAHLRWSVKWDLERGRANWLKAPNGTGKTSLFEEIKVQWQTIGTGRLGFVDQASLVPFHDLTVAQLFDVLWDVASERCLFQSWQRADFWDPESRDLWDRKVGLLSGGENQWIKILMMLSLKSEVWLLDEPFQFLDGGRTQRLLRYLVDWLAQGGVLILSHHGAELPLPFKAWELSRLSSGALSVGEIP